LKGIEMEKKCSKCLETKRLKYFSARTKRKKNGDISYHSWCKKCKNNYVKETRRENNKSFNPSYVPKPKQVRVCDYCGDEFETAHHNKKTCSSDCANAIRNKGWRERAFKAGLRKTPGKEKVGRPPKVKDEKKPIDPKYLTRGNIKYAGIRI
jgi:hypothetical protein